MLSFINPKLKLLEWVYPKIASRLAIFGHASGTYCLG